MTGHPLASKPFDDLHPAFTPERFEYSLLDCGDLKKLEQFGPYRFVRPAPQAIWPRSLPETEWQRAVGEYQYSKHREYSGEWTWHGKFPEEGWPVRFGELVFFIRPTGFGHMGLFPEQAPQWLWLMETVRKTMGNRQVQVINLFGYTGASTLAAAAAGAKVTHVDSSKASVTWARNNLERSGLGGKPVRWIVDDTIKFLKREIRRGNRYDGIIMDPPTFGRGARGEVWKIEKDLPRLMELCPAVWSEDPLFILFTTHTPGFSSLTLTNLLLKYAIPQVQGTLEDGEMFIQDAGSGLHLPNGFYSRWIRT